MSPKKQAKKEPARLVTLQFRFEPGELDEFPLPLFNWAYAEICQNLGFGCLITCKVEDEAEES